MLSNTLTKSKDQVSVFTSASHEQVFAMTIALEW
jgi:hypothetical protein